jgi:hypothetical protein
VQTIRTLATISLGQFDAIVFEPIDGADMDAVRPNNFHMLFDLANSGHTDVLIVGCNATNRCPTN